MLNILYMIQRIKYKYFSDDDTGVEYLYIFGLEWVGGCTSSKSVHVQISGDEKSVKDWKKEGGGGGGGVNTLHRRGNV